MHLRLAARCRAQPGRDALVPNHPGPRVAGPRPAEPQYEPTARDYRIRAGRRRAAESRHDAVRSASLNLAAPDKGRFEYMLEGYDTVTNSRPGFLREAPYSKLPPGPYVFRVRACNEDDVWSNEWATLSIKVLPPFWRTWWFRSLMGAGLLGMIVGSVHYVSTQRLQRQVAALQQKEALERERARIARDIHDQVGANLTQLSLLGELVESDKDDPKEVADHARHIEQTALETTRALDEIVWTVNPPNDTLA